MMEEDEEETKVSAIDLKMMFSERSTPFTYEKFVEKGLTIHDNI